MKLEIDLDERYQHANPVMTYGMDLSAGIDRTALVIVSKHDDYDVVEAMAYLEVHGAEKP